MKNESIDDLIVTLSPDVRLVRREARVLCVNTRTLTWAGLPVTLAPALAEFNGRSVASIRKSWGWGHDFDHMVLRLRASHIVEVEGKPSSEGPSVIARPRVVILKLADGCNMACRYCYDEPSADIRLMSRGVLAKAVLTALGHGVYEHVHFHFHGGEPTLNWPVIEHAVSYIRREAERLGKACSFALGTNGILLSDDRIEWLAENQVSVRLSWDGHGTNSRHRVDHRGRGTADRVWNVIERLCGVPDYDGWSVLVTVTPDNAEHMLECALELQRTGVPSVQFQPCRLQGAAAGKHEFELSGDDYARGMLSLVHAIEAMRLRALRVENILKLALPFLTGYSAQGGCNQSRCGAGDELLVFEANGGISACDTIPRGPFRAIDVLSIGRRYSATRDASHAANLPGCNECLWLRPCKGGCPGAALADDGDFYSRHELACKLHTLVFPEVLGLLDASQPMRDYVRTHLERQLSYFPVDYSG